MPDGPIERTEPTARRADVRVVHVAIDDVRDDALRMLSLADGVRGETELEEVTFADETNSLCRGETLAVGCAREDRIERGSALRARFFEARRRPRQEPRVAR